MESELAYFSPSELALYHRNPRVGNVEVIANSLVAHGQYKPVVVNKGTHTGRSNEVLAGNHTVKAFRDLIETEPDNPRWRTVIGYVIDVDDDAAARIVAVDNRSAELGTFDDAALADLLSSLGELDGTGYTADDLSDLLAGIEETLPPILTDPDAEPVKPPRTGEDGLINSTSVEDQRALYEQAATRLVVLTLPLDRFVWAQDKLALYRAERELESNTDALLALLSDWSGEDPPALPVSEDDVSAILEGDPDPDEGE